MSFSLYACPVCQSTLEKHDNSWRCQANHTFDAHKKGYVNLLLVQNKKSKAPGDDSQMVVSRRRFLEAGNYQPLADLIGKRLGERLDPKANVLDAGCGEGYYTQNIANLNPAFNCYGLDISKPAITAASKYKNIEWCVASSTHAPYVSQQFDAIVSVFSRVDSTPFARLLKTGGKVCMVTPDHDHLLALRKLIYQDVRLYDTQKHKDYLDNRFSLIDEERLTVDISLKTNQTIMDLLGMTPHAHRLSKEARERLEKTAELQDKACFKLYWFEKTNPDTL